MQLLILHYHLNRGGVTRVIENHCRALATLPSSEQPERVVIGYGGRATAWNDQLADELPFPVTMEVVPTLEYDGQTVNATTEGQVAALQHLLSEYGFTPSDSVIHVHNHSLGKNGALPASLIQFASAGWRLLLQIHDFAEDLRPSNYQHLLKSHGSADALHATLYPQATQLHYAVLNTRDRSVLASAGVETNRLHCLPNPVFSTSKVGGNDAQSPEVREIRRRVFKRLEIPEGDRYLLYPVRAIRRKNLGELALWSALTPDATFGMTLAPLNTAERPNYSMWSKFAERIGLPIRFDVGGSGGISLEDNYAACDAVVSTSVAEGFGLVFLEASLADRPLLGRSLPGITDDFISAGIELPGLSDAIWVPMQWIDVDRLKQRYLTWIAELRGAFRLPGAEPKAMRATVDRLFSGDVIDFGRLDSESQKAIVQQVTEKAESRQRLYELNPSCVDAGRERQASFASRLAGNRSVVDRVYSLPVVGKSLQTLYKTVLASELGEVVRDPRIAESVLSSFVQPRHLFPIRLES